MVLSIYFRREVNGMLNVKAGVIKIKRLQRYMRDELN